MAAKQQQVSCFECFVYQKQMSGTCNKLEKTKRGEDRPVVYFSELTSAG